MVKCLQREIQVLGQEKKRQGVSWLVCIYVISCYKAMIVGPLLNHCYFPKCPPVDVMFGKVSTLDPSAYDFGVYHAKQ